MSENKYLHHYTTIDKLALILKSRNIRFNRLDHVDDITEANKYGNFHLSRFLFVSCWTDTDEESIPLWDRYSKEMTGVRISLPVDPFRYQPLKPHPLLGGTVTGELLSFLPIEEIFTNEYIVNSPIMFNKNIFIKKVEYISDDELIDKRKEAVKFIDVNGRPKYHIDGQDKLAGYKSKQWDFQKEVRYIIMIFPSPPFPSTGTLDDKWTDETPKYLLKAISDGTGPNKEFFDIPLDDTHLDSIKVTLAPHATDGDYIIVENLLEKYTKGGTLSRSKLTNQIRQFKK